jgi:hypothetical protein
MDEPRRSLQGRFEAAMEREREREAAAHLPLPLDPDSGTHFSRALANMNIILAAMADGSVDAYWGAAGVADQARKHTVDELLACDLYLMWMEFTDLSEFTEEGGQGEIEVASAMRDAATHWLVLKANEPDELRDYFDRWKAERNLARWRDRLGGPTFDRLDSKGWFRWDST